MSLRLYGVVASCATSNKRLPDYSSRPVSSRPVPLGVLVVRMLSDFSASNSLLLECWAYTRPLAFIPLMPDMAGYNLSLSKASYVV